MSQEILGDSGADTSKHACEFHELRSKCASESQGRALAVCKWRTALKSSREEECQAAKRHDEETP